MTDNLPPRGPWTALVALLIVIGLAVLAVITIIVLAIERIAS